MTAMTTVRDGNWEDPVALTTCWTTLTGSGAGGIAGLTDTATISKHVTVGAAQVMSIGQSPQDITTFAMSITSVGWLTLASGSELKAYGNVQGVGAGSSGGTSRLEINGSNTWLTFMSSANVTTPNRYLLIAGAGATQSFRVDINGTSLAAPAGIRSDLSTSFWNTTGYASLSGQFGKCINGLSANVQDGSCWSGGAYPHPGSVYNLTDWIFDGCGQITVGAISSAGCTCTLTRVTFQNTPSAVRWNWAPKNSNCIWTMDRIMLDAPAGQSQTDLDQLRATNVVMISTSLTATHAATSGANTTLENIVCIAQHAGVLSGYGSTTLGNAKNVVLWMRSSLCKILSADPASNIITLDKAHTFTTGAQVDFCDTYGGGPVPGGLIAGADVGVQYFVRSVDSTHITVHTSSANASANSNLYDITSTGTGSVSLINPHFSAPPLAVEGRIYYLEGIGKGGDLHNGPSGSVAGTIRNNRALMSPRGISPGVGVSGLSAASTWTYTYNHNTGYSTNGGLVHSGEGGATSSRTGQIDSIRSNIALVATADGVDPQHAIYTNEYTTTADKAVAARVSHNIVHGGGTAFDTMAEAYNLTNQATPAGTNDQYNVDCDFIEETRGPMEWAAWFGARLGLSGDGITTPGTQATHENAILILRNLWNGTIAHADAIDGVGLFTQYLNRGLIPRLLSIRATGHDGLTPGADGAWCPTLTTPTATATQGGFTTNCPDGAAYWVITTSATTPDEDRIRAGKDHTGTTVGAGFSGTVAVTSSGAKTFSYSPTLLAATDYYLHQCHAADATANGDAAQPAYLRTSVPITSAAFQAASSGGSDKRASYVRSNIRSYVTAQAA